MKNKSKLEVNITMPVGYKKKVLNEIINDEISIAERKWQVNTTNEEKEIILEHSFKQLEARVQEVFKTDWTVDSKNSVFIFNSDKDLSINIPFKSSDEYAELSFLKLRNCWEVDNDNRAEAVSAKDLYSSILEEIESWLRTAVFYSVASFS